MTAKLEQRDGSAEDLRDDPPTGTGEPEFKAALTGACDNLRDAEVEIGRLRQEAKILKGMLPKLYRDDGTNGDRVHILRTATFPKAVRRWDEQGLNAAMKRPDFDEEKWITEQDIKE